jgi:hypothetical protein
MKKYSILVAIATMVSFLASCQKYNPQTPCSPGYVWSNSTYYGGAYGTCVPINTSLTGNNFNGQTPPAQTVQYTQFTWGLPFSLLNGLPAYEYGGNVVSALGGYVAGYAIQVDAYNPSTGQLESVMAFVPTTMWGAIQIAGAVNTVSNLWSGDLSPGQTYTGVSLAYAATPIGQTTSGIPINFQITSAVGIPKTF